MLWLILSQLIKGKTTVKILNGNMLADSGILPYRNDSNQEIITFILKLNTIFVLATLKMKPG